MSSSQLQIERPADEDDDDDYGVVVHGQISEHSKNDQHHPPPPQQQQQQQGRQGTALTLPAMESSPYLKYSDLEQYKRNAYGSDQLGFQDHHHQHDPKHNVAANYEITSIPKEEAAAAVDRKLK